tara:strand:- start:5860 stop:6192 length:333 start_codon:yes stop_codon:yes gene_type:complete
MDIKNIFKSEEGTFVDCGGGLRRKVTAYNDNLMVVEVHFETGTHAAVHSHPHEQITYVISGEFEFIIDGKKQILKAGDAAYKQGHLPHGATCLQKGMLIDVFTPLREDFL